MLESRRVSLKDVEKEQQSVYDRRKADEELNSIVNKIRSFFNIRGA